MHYIQAVCEHRWVVPISLVVGVVVIAIGVAMHGELGADLFMIGIVVSMAALAEGRVRKAVRNGHAEAHRAGYRLGMRVRRAQLIAVSYPRQDERVASK